MSSLTRLLFTIMAILLIVLIYIFVPSLILETSKEEMIPILNNVSEEFYNQSMISEQMRDYIQSENDDFANFDWEPDLFFVFAIVVIFASTVIISIKSRKAGPIAFLGYITFIMAFVLTIGGIIIQIIVWFKSEIYDRVLINLPYSTPIMDVFMSNVGPILAVWGILLILINQFEFSGSKGLEREFDE